MNNELKMIEAIAPDMLNVVQDRFQILRNVYWMAPIGRRVLAQKMGVTERVLRTETDVLKRLQLLDSSKSGMSLTEKGLTVFHGLETIVGQLQGMRQKEKQLADVFQIQHCIIIAGDSDQQAKILQNFGKVVTHALSLLLPEGENIIAVMGGTTMAAVAENMSPLEKKNQRNLFVPARGGIGEAMNVQANSVSAMMSSKTGGFHRVLYVPEQVSPETYKPLLQEPSVQEVLGLIKRANCVIHSVGKALHMAARRGMSDKDLAMLKQRKAVAESFGYFFNEHGEVVYKIPRIGLQLKDLRQVPFVIAVVGGKSKAKVIKAYMKNAPKQTWLITDEGAANEILKGVSL